jgi:acetyl-CoA acetyltransferase
MTEAVIVSTARTPIGKAYRGALNNTEGPTMAGHVIAEALNVPWTRERFKGRPDDFFIKPAAIAEEAWHLTQQDRSGWSFNVEMRPYGENW